MEIALNYECRNEDMECSNTQLNGVDRRRFSCPTVHVDLKAVN